MTRTEKDVYRVYLDIIMGSMDLLRDGITKKDMEKIKLAKEALATLQTCVKYGGMIVKGMKNLDTANQSEGGKRKE